MSKKNDRPLRGWGNEKPLAPWAHPDGIDAECRAVSAWIKAHGAGMTPMQREALWQIVTTPYEVSSIEEACVRAAAILEALSEEPDADTASQIFESALCRARSPEARS